MKTYKTKNGTELPILDLRGKDYLEVKYRIVWFREDHPDWAIETSFISLNEKSACAQAVIKDASGRVVTTSHKFENVQGFADFIEKAETGAIGRALALIGYGTQFCADDLDEGKRLADAPGVRPKKMSTVTQKDTPPPLVVVNAKPKTNVDPKEPASIEQKNSIIKMASSLGLDDAAIKDLFQTITGKATSKEWTRDDIDRLLKGIVDFKKGKPPLEFSSDDFDNYS